MQYADEHPDDVHADMILTAEGEMWEPDPEDLAIRQAQAEDEQRRGPMSMFPVSPGAPEFVGAYGRIYVRTDETEPDGEPIWQDEDGDYGTMDQLESAIWQAEANEAMGGDSPF